MKCLPSALAADIVNSMSAALLIYVAKIIMLGTTNKSQIKLHSSIFLLM